MAHSHAHTNHGHGHSHGHGHRREGGPQSVESALAWALLLNGGFLVIEAGVGWVTGSLALLSDAAHMLSDVGALVLALGAARLARRAADVTRSFGFRRAEVLGAFINGLALLVACGFIVSEAAHRLLAGPPDVPGWPVFAVGAVGLAINLGSAWQLSRSDRGNLNIRGALLHMLADALGSLGAMIAALLVVAGYPAADPVVSLGIAALVLAGCWGLLRDSGRVLLQFAPAGVDVPALRAAVQAQEGVAEVHDLHLWTLDGQSVVLSAHLVIAPGYEPAVVRQAAHRLLDERWGIAHTTLQVETRGDCSGAPCEPPPERPAPPDGDPDPDRDHGHDHDHDQGHDPDQGHGRAHG